MESIQTLNYYLCMFQFYGKIVLVTVYIGSAVNCQFLCFFTIAQASGLTTVFKSLGERWLLN